MTKQLRIAMIGQKRCPSREGGVEIVVEELATRMVKLGHSVTCYNRSGHHVSGKEFDTTDGRMIYCCRKCSEKYRHNKAKAEKIVYHRICKECGTEFDTTNQRKIFCCRDHAFRYKQRQYRKEKEYGYKQLGND